MTYTDYIKNYIGQQQPGEPIFTEMVSDKVAVAFGLDKKKAAAAAEAASSALWIKTVCLNLGVIERVFIIVLRQLHSEKPELTGKNWLQ